MLLNDFRPVRNVMLFRERSFSGSLEKIESGGDRRREYPKCFQPPGLLSIDSFIC